MKNKFIIRIFGIFLCVNLCVPISTALAAEETAEELVLSSSSVTMPEDEVVSASFSAASEVQEVVSGSSVSAAEETVSSSSVIPEATPTPTPTPAPTQTPTPAPTVAPTPMPIPAPSPDSGNTTSVVNPDAIEGTDAVSSSESEVPETDTAQEVSGEQAEASADETGADTETDAENEDEKWLDDIKDEEAEQEETDETEEEEEKDGAFEASEPDANMIANAHIVDLPDLEPDFRLVHVDAEHFYVRDKTCIYESPSENSRIVSELYPTWNVYFLSNVGDGWGFVESGNARGFMRIDMLAEDSELAILKMEQLQDLQLPFDEAEYQNRIMNFEKEGLSKIPNSENQAFLYTHTTARQTIIDKEYAVAKSEVPVNANAYDGAVQVGTLPANGLAFIIEKLEDGWLYIESNNVRGFIPETAVVYDNDTQNAVKENGESSYPEAAASVSAAENPATYYSIMSVYEYSESDMLRDTIIEAARACIGNPYVWGGTDLEKGADCSGFVQTLYGYYGIGMPRIAAAQAQVGIKITQADAKPGDLVFYASGTDIYHVAIYAGDGKTIEAYSSDMGIIDYTVQPNVCWFCNVIDSPEDLGL